MISIVGTLPVIAESVERIPCVEEELCQRTFGTRSEDVAHFGNVPPCQQYGWVRCIVVRPHQTVADDSGSGSYTRPTLSYRPDGWINQMSKPDDTDPSSYPQQYPARPTVPSGMARHSPASSIRIKEASFLSGGSAQHSMQLDGQSFSFDIRPGNEQQPSRPFHQPGTQSPALPVVVQDEKFVESARPAVLDRAISLDAMRPPFQQQVAVKQSIDKFLQPAALSPVQSPPVIHRQPETATRPSDANRRPGNPQNLEPIHTQSFQLNQQKSERPAQQPLPSITIPPQQQQVSTARPIQPSTKMPSPMDTAPPLPPVDRSPPPQRLDVPVARALQAMPIAKPPPVQQTTVPSARVITAAGQPSGSNPRSSSGSIGPLFEPSPPTRPPLVSTTRPRPAVESIQQPPSSNRRAEPTVNAGGSIAPSDALDEQTMQQIFAVFRAALSSGSGGQFSTSSGSPALTPIGPLPLETEK